VHVAHRWSGSFPCVKMYENSGTCNIDTHTMASRPKEATQVSAFLVYGENPFHVLLRWPGWGMTYEPLRMTYYALFSFSTPAARTVQSKNIGDLLKKCALFSYNMRLSTRESKIITPKIFLYILLQVMPCGMFGNGNIKIGNTLGTLLHIVIVIPNFLYYISVLYSYSPSQILYYIIYMQFLSMNLKN